MMRALIFGAVAFGMSCAAAPVAAQTPPGQFDPFPQQTSRVKATMAIATCVAQRRPDDAAQFVLADSNERSAAAAKKLDDTFLACLGAKRESITMRHADLRGALAETLLKADGARLLSQARARPAVPPQRLAAVDEAGPGAVFLCTVGAQPQIAAKLLDAAPETVEEGAQFDALAPSLQACMPTTGSLSIKAFQVRGLVATALFRLAHLTGGA